MPTPNQLPPLPAGFTLDEAAALSDPSLPDKTGMTVPGTITNVFHRPILNNPDGGYSTTSSMSFQDPRDGLETLIPTVVDGKRLSTEQAKAHYAATGEHLGKFKDWHDADRYAQALHETQAQYIDQSGQRMPPLPPGFTLDGDSPPDSGWKRNAALGGRAAVEGVASIPTSPADIMMNSPVAQILGPSNPVSLMGKISQETTSHTPVFWAVKAFNKLSGANVPETETFQNLLENAMTQTGAPVPQTSGEKLAYAAEKGAAAGLTGGVAGGATGVANVLRAAASGASGGTAAEATKQAGGGTLAQMAAGIAGGMAPAAIEGTARLAGRSVAGIIRPMTKGGQEDMAASILQQNASDPLAAAARLNAAGEAVPGSPRTTGEASQDVGVLALEKGIRGRNAAPFGEKLSEQNAARQAELSKVAGTPADIAAAKMARDVETGALRESALGGERPAAQLQAVQDTIDQILASPAGKRETISKSIEWARNQIAGETDPATLYEIRKDLQLAQLGKLHPSSPNAPNASTLAQARGQLKQVVSSLDDAIEAAAPGFKAYLKRYSELSKPIDEMQVLQEIRRRSQLTSADITTQQRFLGAADFNRALDGAIARSGAKLTPDKLERLEAIRTDLRYGQAINSPLVKAVGSDTFQNLSIAQAIGAGRVATHPAIQVLTKPLRWLYSGADERVNEILVSAMLDPKFGAQLLTRATPKSISQFAGDLRQALKASGLATTAVVAPTAIRGSQSPDMQQPAQGSN